MIRDMLKNVVHGLGQRCDWHK